MRDSQFELCVEALAEAMTPVQVPLSIRFPQIVLETFVELYEAFATPEPGFISRAIRGLVV